MINKRNRKNSENQIYINLPLNEAIVLLVGLKLLNELVEGIEIDYIDNSEVIIDKVIKKLLNILPNNVDKMTSEIIDDILGGFFSTEINISDLDDNNYNYPMYTIKEKLPLIKKAIKLNNAIDIEYYYLEKEEVKKHKIYPYGMKKQNNFYLLVAYSTEAKEIQVFRVDRIKSLSILNEQFTKPEDFKIENYLKLSYQ